MRVIVAPVKRIFGNNKDLDKWLVGFVFFGILFSVDACIPHANKNYAPWMLLVFALCISLLWLAGRKYIRITIALLILALSIILVFGLTGTQQTTAARVNGKINGNIIYMEYADTDSPSGVSTITAKVTEQDSIQFSYKDEVLITYRDVFLFGFLHLGTSVDSLDSVPVVEAGSRNATASEVWWPITLGALPLILLAMVFLLNRLHPRK